MTLAVNVIDILQRKTLSHVGNQPKLYLYGHPSPISEFCSLYNLTNLVEVPTCYKNYINPTSIDLILTNRSTYFHSTRTLETGLSDFHKMTVTVMKTRYKKYPPKVILYRDYKRFSNTIFHAELQYMLIEQNIYHSSNHDFVDMTMRILNRHAPLKQKYIRANNAPFMTKELRKAIMNRSKLKNKSNSVNTREAHHEYKKQRNLCTYLLKKSQKRLL